MATLNKVEMPSTSSASIKAKDLLNKYGVILVLLVMVIVLSIITPAFLKTQNIFNIIRQVSIITIIGFGATFILIIAGTDLSSGSVVALTSVVVASCAHPNQYPFIVTLLIGIGVAVVCGFINGFLVATFDIQPFIATLGMFTAARGAALLYSDGKPIGGFTPAFDFIGTGSLLGIPFPIILLIVVSIISYLILDQTKFGSYTRSIGANQRAAVISGINVKKHKLLVFTYAGIMTGIAAIILTSRIGVGSPSSGISFEMDAMAAAVIGGTSLNGGIGTIPGTIIGGLIIGVLNNGMDLLGISAYWQQIMKGIIIVGAVIFDQKKQKR